MTPTKAVEKFFEHNPRTGGKDGNSRRKGGEPWTNKTREQFRLPALLLEQIMHGAPLATVTHDHLVQLNNCFEALHGPSFRKSPKHRTMTIWQIVEETEERVRQGETAIAKAAKRKGAADSVEMPAGALTRDQLGLGLSTTNRHWGFLRQLTTWFEKHHPLSTLDYGAFIEFDDRDARKQRQGYTAEQGAMLFSLPPWTGSKSLARRMQPGDLRVHCAWYFVPLIGWYTGMRREESVAAMGRCEHVHPDPHEERGARYISSNRPCGCFADCRAAAMAALCKIISSDVAMRRRAEPHRSFRRTYRR